MESRGKFIVLEGQGFSGKTEQSSLLTDRLGKLGVEVVSTQEPGGVGSALAIREELLRRRAGGLITPEEEVSLFYRARGAFLSELVIPSLDDGRWVVSTRFSASTHVYQGVEGGVSLDLIGQLDDQVVGNNQPDLYLLLNVTPEEILRRMTSSARQRHSYNELDMAKIKARHRGYLGLARENRHGNWVVVEGNGSIAKVSEDIWTIVTTRFNLC